MTSKKKRWGGGEVWLTVSPWRKKQREAYGKGEIEVSFNLVKATSREKKKPEKKGEAALPCLKKEEASKN